MRKVHATCLHYSCIQFSNIIPKCTVRCAKCFMYIFSVVPPHAAFSAMCDGKAEAAFRCSVFKKLQWGSFLLAVRLIMSPLPLAKYIDFEGMCPPYWSSI